MTESRRFSGLVKHWTDDGEPGIDVARENGIPDQTFRKRVQSGWSVDDAARVPIGAGPTGGAAHRRKGRYA